MRVLLIETQYHSCMPNLGLGYLSAVLRREGHAVELWLNNKRLNAYSSFLELISRERFDVIGLQVMSSAIKNAREIIARIRASRNNRAKIILGGAHISGDPQGVFDIVPHVDYAFYGESENGIVEFAKRFSDCGIRSADKIPNLVYRDGAKTLINPGKFVEQLDEIPFPAWELMEPDKFPVIPFNGYSRRYPIAPMVLTRGCPNLCTFCGAGAVNGRNIRSRSVKNIMEEIRLLINKFGVKEIQFFDSNCAHRQGPLRELCEHIISENIDITWSAPNGIRVDSIDKDLAVLMKRSGCFQVNVGIESASPRILKEIKKPIASDMVREKISLLRKAGIEVVGFFMIGFPGETASEIKRTISFAMELPITGASFSILSPLPGTGIYEDAYKNRKMDINNFNLLDFINYHNDLSEVSYDNLREIQKKAYLRFYLRPRVMQYFLRNLNSVSKAMFIAKRAYLNSFKG